MILVRTHMHLYTQIAKGKVTQSELIAASTASWGEISVLINFNTVDKIPSTVQHTVVSKLNINEDDVGNVLSITWLVLKQSEPSS